ncbi:polysaccharide deacetylase family protein [Candidatus Gracilibacteria bacterium]|nr:polysaccharide deacetylase family protein [Candidatus Gracilibacteria bacterium]
MKILTSILAFVFLSGCGGANVLGVGEIGEVSDQVPILMYHYVREVDKVWDPLGWNLSVSPELFERQMEYLQGSGYSSISMGDFLLGHADERSVVLTFDDGLSDFYATALPILEKYNFKASNAVISGFIGREGHMNEDEIFEIMESGVEILSHSVYHKNLASLSDADIRFEVSSSRDDLEERFGVNIRGFVYPSGKFDRRVMRILGEEGYSFALSTEYGEADLGEHDLMLLPRIRVDNRGGYEGFVKRLEELE